MPKLFFALISLFVAISCSSQNSNQLPKSIRDISNLKTYSLPNNIDTVQLNQQLVFNNTKDVIIGRIGDIAVDKNGRVFIADMSKKIINVFQSGGTYLTHIGRKGKGPGEFLTIAEIRIRYHKLYVYDTLLQKISVFSLSSLYLLNETGINSVDGMRGEKFYIKNKNTYLIGFKDPGIPNSKRYIHFYVSNRGKLDISHEVLKGRINNIYQLKSNGHVFWGVDPGGRTTLITANNNRIFTAWSDHFLIKVYSLKGKYLQAFYYPYQNYSFNKRYFINHELPKTFHKISQNLQYPRTWSALHSMKADDQNRLWVSTNIKNPNVYQWWVLNSYGKLLGRFQWAKNKPIKKIKNGYIYTIEKNKQGVQRVVKYKIEMEKNKHVKI